jgi:casein kinase II subunit alpha
LFGTEQLKKFIEKYKIKTDDCIRKLLKKENYHEKRGLRSIRQVRKIPKHAFDLMEKLLAFDHNDRLLAKEALNHPFFTKAKSKKRTQSNKQHRKT